MRSVKAIVAVTLAAATFVACDRNPAEQNGPRLTLSADSLVVNVGVSASAAAAVLNTSEPAQYASRDPNVATVNALGAVTGVAAGSTYVVAALPSHPDVRDSVRVRVYSDSCGGARPDFGGMATAADRDLFSYDVDAPLNLQKTVESTTNGVEASSISFSSPDGGLATGMMWDPVTRPGPRPGMVVMHGLPGKARDFAGLGQNYARNGAVVIAIDAPWNRRAAPPYLTITAQDRAEQIQVAKDLQRAVDVLRSHPNVDEGRIAFVGFSWGGATGALLVGIERRLKAAALVVGHGGQVSHATGPEGFKYISGLPCARRVAWIRAMAPIEPVRFVGHANVPLLLQNGTSDEFIPTADAAELHAAAPQPKDVRWYQAGHSLTPQAGVDRYDWLVEKIGIDPMQPAPTGSKAVP
jgi:dienelactone hydrolase